eukprot:scaffold231372_cov17-Tisochrysis_lutea.AAC.2
MDSPSPELLGLSLKQVTAAFVATYLKTVDGPSPRAAGAVTAFVQQTPLGIGTGGFPARR